MTVQEMLDEYGVDLDALQSWLDTHGKESEEIESLGEMCGMTKLQVLATKYAKLLKSAQTPVLRTELSPEEMAKVEEVIREAFNYVVKSNYELYYGVELKYIRHNVQDGQIYVIIKFPQNINVEKKQRIQTSLPGDMEFYLLQRGYRTFSGAIRVAAL